MTSIQKADHYRVLEARYRDLSKSLERDNKFTAAIKLEKEADACLGLYLRYMRHVDERYTWKERLLMWLGFEIV